MLKNLTSEFKIYDVKYYQFHFYFRRFFYFHRFFIVIFLHYLHLITKPIITTKSRFSSPTYNYCATYNNKFKAFDRVWNTLLLHKFKFQGILGSVFDIILSFLRSKQLQVLFDQKLLQEHSVNAGELPQLLLRFSFYTLMKFLMMLYAKVLYILMIILSTLSGIRLLTCSNNYS